MNCVPITWLVWRVLELICLLLSLVELINATNIWWKSWYLQRISMTEFANATITWLPKHAIVLQSSICDLYVLSKSRCTSFFVCEIIIQFRNVCFENLFAQTVFVSIFGRKSFTSWESIFVEVFVLSLDQYESQLSYRNIKRMF